MAAPQHEAPEGMDKYDYFALNEQQQQKLNEHKIATRIANEQYLRKHPELDCLLKKIINVSEQMGINLRKSEVPDV